MASRGKRTATVDSTAPPPTGAPAGAMRTASPRGRTGDGGGRGAQDGAGADDAAARGGVRSARADNARKLAAGAAAAPHAIATPHAVAAPHAAPHAVAPALLAWYDRHARALPWRAPPGAPPPDPYHVWLSEIMLQQTTVAAVTPYFARFLAEWPDVRALAAAPDAAVMAAWAGLGYYARARSLLACARAVAAAGGAFPGTETGLRALPGIGPYTAAAVAAIAFGRPAVVVDGNVERVVARLFAIAAPLPGAKPAIRDAAAALTPSARPGDFAQAMMDLGATVCTPRAPRCLLCPLSALCAARAQGRAEAFPIKPARLARPRRTGHAFWIERAGAAGREVWLERRPGRGLLGGMRALPDDGWRARADGGGRWAGAPAAAPGPLLGVVRHVFTHFELALRVVPLVLAPGDPRLTLPAPATPDALAAGAAGLASAAVPGEDGATDVGAGWWPVARLGEAGLPAVFARAATLAMAGAAGDNTAAGAHGNGARGRGR